MSLIVTANRTNRAVSPGSTSLVATTRKMPAKRLFCLTDNKLDGSYVPFSTVDDGWWDSRLSDAAGYLSDPAVIDISQRVTAYMLQVNGHQGVFPVDFSIDLYNAGRLIGTEHITDNDQHNRVVTLSTPYEVDRYVVTITRINKASDVLRISTLSFSVAMSELCRQRARKMHAKLEIVYNNPMYGLGGIATSDASAYSARPEQLLDGMQPSNTKLFRLYDNRLDGSYRLAGKDTQVGWWPSGMPDADGVYSDPKRVTITFSARPLFTHHVRGYAPTNDFPVDFNLYVVDTSGIEHIIEVRDNALLDCSVDVNINNAVSMSLEVLRSSNPSRPAVITDLAVASSVVYNDGDIIDVNILEELTYEDANESLGCVSANELVANISNVDGSFYFNNAESLIAGQLKKNRRIKAWLGVDTDDGVTLWSDMGTFWSHSWQVPVRGLTARVTAFDTIGLLSTFVFENHRVFVDKSVGYMLDYLFNDAKKYFSELAWQIDAALYDIIIPYGWFAYGSYAAALETLAACDLFYIYCDRFGKVIARMRSENVSSAYAELSDSTNVISTTYPTMYTDLANHVDVAIAAVTEVTGEVLNYSSPMYVTAGDRKHLQFSKPMLSMSAVSIESTAEVNYEVYSWGMTIDALSDGIVGSVVVNGVYLEVDTSQLVTRRDNASILANGAVLTTVTSNFIQSREHAVRIADRLFADTSLTKYDADVTYRGDITLGIGDPVELIDGVSPISKYYVKRHELYYNGALTGTLKLNT